MVRTIVFATVIMLASIANAAEPTLNDLPAVLQQLRGCEPNRFSFSGPTCRLSAEEVWVAIHTDRMTIFYGSTSDMITGSGNTVPDMLRSFGTKLNGRRAGDKQMLDALAPFLPSQ